jgi:hypothetical protein
MDRSKIIAILTGAISLLLGVGYLVLVQLLDFRGEMLPAPLEQLPITGMGEGLQDLLTWAGHMGAYLRVGG